MFSAKIQDGRQKLKKWKIFDTCLEASPTTLRVKNSIEIALSLTVFDIFAIFHFPQKFKMAAQNCKIWKFWYFAFTLLFHPAGPKFARNRSISYGFRDICDFSFSAKIPQRNIHGGHLVSCKTFRLIPKKALTMMNISYKFGKCTFYGHWYTGTVKDPQNSDKNARGGHLVFRNVPKNILREVCMMINVSGLKIWKV